MIGGIGRGTQHSRTSEDFADFERERAKTPPPLSTQVKIICPPPHCSPVKPRDYLPREGSARLPDDLISLTNSVFEEIIETRPVIQALDNVCPSTSDHADSSHTKPPEKDLLVRLDEAIKTHLHTEAPAKQSAPLLKTAIQSDDLKLRKTTYHYIRLLREETGKEIYTLFSKDADFKKDIESRVKKNTIQLQDGKINSLEEVKGLIADIMLFWRLKYVNEIPANTAGLFTISKQYSLPLFLYQNIPDFLKENQKYLGCVLAYFRTPPQASDSALKLMRLIAINHPKTTIEELCNEFSLTQKQLIAIQRASST